VHLEGKAVLNCSCVNLGCVGADNNLERGMRLEKDVNARHEKGHD